MTEKFVASNGITVTMPECDRVVFASSESETENWVGSHELDALREFFQHERDTELGRWRWATANEWVAYRLDTFPSESRAVRVVNETTGYSGRFTEGGSIVGGERARMGAAVARAYFAAHPEPKPWHEAKEGEVWIIRLSRGQEAGEVFEAPAIFQAGRFRDHGGSWEAREVVDARRIYPEVSGA